MTLKDAIKHMQHKLMGNMEQRLVLEVRRSHIVKDSLKEAKKERFDVKKFLKVC